MTDHIHRLLKFGKKAMRFMDKARHVRELLSSMDLETVAKSLEIHP